MQRHEEHVLNGFTASSGSDKAVVETQESGFEQCHVHHVVFCDCTARPGDVLCLLNDDSFDRSCGVR